MTDTQTASETIETVTHYPGYVGKGRYRRVECDWYDPIEGAERLWAEIRCDLPFVYLENLPMTDDDTYRDLWETIAPHVRAWNACGLDIKTGTYQPVPPPADMGPDAFNHVDPQIGVWIGRKLKQTYREAITDPKSLIESMLSAPTPKPSNASASDSPAPAKPSRKNRKASPATSPST